MMYWIVYAVFVASESLLDPFLLFWFPFYCECKTIFLLYLVSSSTRGSSVIYRSWVHPALSCNEVEIDLAIEKVKVKSLQLCKAWVRAGVTRVGGFVTKTALNRGGGLVTQLQRSFSMVDLANMDHILSDEVTDTEDKTDKREKEPHLNSRLKHYRSEECLHNPSYSSLRRWRPSDMMLSNNSISSGYSTDSLLPTFEDQEEKFDRTQFSRYEAIQMRAEEIMNQERQVEQMMMTRQRTKRKLQENMQSKN